jgi:hypothetical protein
LGREYIKDKVDLFIDLKNKSSKNALLLLKKLYKELQGNIDFDLHFLAIEENGEFRARGGQPLIEEYKRSICIMTHYPDVWWDYILCRSDNIDSSWWDDCINNQDWDLGLIRDCSRSEEANALLRKNIKLTEELKISYGPLILLNNQEIFGITDKTSVSELKKIIKGKVKE